MEGQTPDNPNGQPRQESSESTSNVSPEILSALGLSAEDLKTHENSLREEALRITRENGEEFYNRFDIDNPSGVQTPRIMFLTDEQARTVYGKESVHGEGISVRMPTSKSLLPDNIALSFQAVKEIDDDEYIEYYKSHARSFVEGYGAAAIEAGDWDTALAAFDIATPGGVVHNEEAIAKMRELSIEDKIKIATKIQKRAREMIPSTNIPVAGALAASTPQAT